MFPVWVWGVATLVYVLRRPDMVLNPQPWAEDGVVFIRGALSHGWASLWSPHAGYFHTTPKLAANLAVQISQSLGQGILLVPALMNLVAIIIGTLCVAFVCSARFDWLAGVRWRAALVFLVITLPNVSEIFGNITNIQWWLGYFFFLWSWDVWHRKRVPLDWTLAVLALGALTTPQAILPVAVATFVLLRRAVTERAVSGPLAAQAAATLALGGGVAVQYFTAIALRNDPTGLKLTLGPAQAMEQFIRVLLTGTFARLIIPHIGHVLNWVGFIVTNVAGLVMVSVLAFSRGRPRPEHLFPLLYITLALALVYLGTPSFFVDYRLPFGARGERYLFVPMAAVATWMVALLAASEGVRERPNWGLRALLALMACTEIFSFKFAPYADMNWASHARFFDRSGDSAHTFPINPDWKMTIPASATVPSDDR